MKRKANSSISTTVSVLVCSLFIFTPEVGRSIGSYFLQGKGATQSFQTGLGEVKTCVKFLAYAPGSSSIPAVNIRDPSGQGTTLYLSSVPGDIKCFSKAWGGNKVQITLIENIIIEFWTYS